VFMLLIAFRRYHPFGLAAAERLLTSAGHCDPRLSFLATVVDLSIFLRQGVAMDTVVVETVVEVQELTLAELAQVGGGLGDAVLI
jgi:hypothetical protein